MRYILPIARYLTSAGIAARCQAMAGGVVGKGAETVVVSQLAEEGGSARPRWQEVTLAGLALIGTSLDLNRTAREAASVAVPAFADAAAIFVFERLLVADELGPYPAGPAVVRRLVSKLADQP